MAVNVVHYEHQGTRGWGVVRKRRVTPIEGSYPTTGDFLRAHSATTLADLGGADMDERDVRILSPVTRNQQFVCQGANYRQHMIESGMNPDEKTFNMIFRKASSCIVSADSKLLRPRHVTLLDYELELGLVIARDVAEAMTG